MHRTIKRPCTNCLTTGRNPSGPGQCPVCNGTGHITEEIEERK